MSLPQMGKIYTFTCMVFPDKKLNLYGSAEQGKNVVMWDEDGSLEQQWKYDSSGKLLTMKNTSFVLDRYAASGTQYNNADVWPNDPDEDANQIVAFEETIFPNTVKIRLASTNLYLQANSGNGTSGGKSTTSTGNAYWDVSVGEDNELWVFSEVGATSGGGDTTNFERNYLTYPCSHMKITQTPEDGNHIYCSTENPYDYPIDDRCESAAGRSWMYCPCDEMKIVRIYGVNNSSKTNTIWLESTSPVVMPCGISKVTMMVIHPEDDDLAGLSVGDTFTRGEAMFREGMDGYATGNHFHFAIGKGDSQGWVGKSHNQWSLSTSGGCIRPEDAFYIDNTFTYIEDAKGIDFQTLPQ